MAGVTAKGAPDGSQSWTYIIQKRLTTRCFRELEIFQASSSKKTLNKIFNFKRGSIVQ